VPRTAGYKTVDATHTDVAAGRVTRTGNDACSGGASIEVTGGGCGETGIGRPGPRLGTQRVSCNPVTRPLRASITQL